MTMADEAQQRIDFDRIFLGGKSHLREGKLRLASSGIGWKDAKSGQMVTVAAADIKRMQWLRAAKDHELRVVHKNGSVLKFDGFPGESQSELKQTLKRMYGTDLEAKELSVRGWNWGQTEFQGNSLFLNLANKPVVEIPMAEVSNTAVAAKNEVSLEFRLPTAEQARETPEIAKGDQLVEIRFYLPDGKPAAASALDDKEDVGNLEEAELDADGNPIQSPVPSEEDETSAAQQFYETVKTKADLGMVVGEAIAPFHELPFITPRGRYEVEMFSDFLRMHGKSYDYKILFKSIKHLFLLPKPDDIHVLFVIGLDPPIRQGQTRYPFLVMQFMRDEDVEITMNMEEEELKERFGGRLKPAYDAPTYEVVSTVFNVMSEVPISTPQSFKSHYGYAGIKCSLKVNEGLIYPLEDSLLFVPKPTTYMPFVDIATIIFSRVGGGGGVSGSRTFDMKIIMKKGGDFMFSGLNKEEHTLLDAFLKSKKLKVKNEMAPEEILHQLGGSSSEEESDDEDGGARKKAKTSATALGGAGDEDDDESDDEDYVAEEESDVPEEYDENYSSSGSGSDDGEEGGSDAADDDDEE